MDGQIFILSAGIFRLEWKSSMFSTLATLSFVFIKLEQLARDKHPAFAICRLPFAIRHLPFAKWLIHKP
jgi:hypothetical protein